MNGPTSSLFHLRCLFLVGGSAARNSFLCCPGLRPHSAFGFWEKSSFSVGLTVRVVGVCLLPAVCIGSIPSCPVHIMRLLGLEALPSKGKIVDDTILHDLMNQRPGNYSSLVYACC